MPRLIVRCEIDFSFKKTLYLALQEKQPLLIILMALDSDSSLELRAPIFSER